MAAIEKNAIKTEAVFSDDKKNRYVLKKEWDKNKKKAMVLMVNPSYADGMLIDPTTMYVMNNLSKLDFGSVDIVNIFSSLDGSRSVKAVPEEVMKENAEHIMASAEKADMIIIAWGKVGDGSKSIEERQRYFLDMLAKYKDKLYTLGFHPLAPRMRASWNLGPFKEEAKKA
ncbi:MAG: DUF1643 domain-containing protein [Pelosinus sp.]|nr:DUF1643 domain-containing protein [Pelosinus sp.]